MKYLNLAHKIMAELLILTTVALPLLYLTGCSRKNEVVARFNNQTITLQEFNEAYFELLKKPDIFDSVELREKYLDELIDQRLMANQARQMGLHYNEKISRKVWAYRNKCLRDAHFQKVIRPEIQYSDEDVAETFQYMIEQRHVQHLWFKTEDEALYCYDRLAKGAEWMDCAKNLFTDSILAASGGNLDWVYWDQMEYDMAQTAFRLELNTISKPVASSYGFHLIRVIDYRKNPLVSVSDFKQARQKIRYLLEQKIGNKLAGEYIKKLMDKKNIRINPQILKSVAQHLGTVFRRKPSQFDQMLTAQLTPREISELEQNLWDLRNKALAEIDGEVLTVGEFMYQLNYIPYGSIATGMRTTLNFAIRDRVLTDDAIRLKLDRHVPDVHIKTSLYKEYLLQIDFRKSLIKGIKVDSAEIEQLLKDFNHTGKGISNAAEAREILSRHILIEEQTQAVADFIRIQRQQSGIEKFIKPIHTYYGEICARLD
ncbi:MAG: peptidylprolyl isomerase [Candidatus Marinimicrobia bacterium]|nr:peptidylprolyl isomerase [Candidatus Neomarinimicrobiota bacterium]